MKHQIGRWIASAVVAVIVAAGANNVRAQDVETPTAVVIQVQRKLAAQRYYVGPFDGVLGTKTRTAIRAYQKKNRLPATGLPSRRTLVKLNLIDDRPFNGTVYHEPTPVADTTNIATAGGTPAFVPPQPTVPPQP